jgi:hypothetical protein
MERIEPGMSFLTIQTGATDAVIHARLTDGSGVDAGPLSSLNQLRIESAESSRPRGGAILLRYVLQPQPPAISSGVAERVPMDTIPLDDLTHVDVRLYGVHPAAVRLSSDAVPNPRLGTQESVTTDAALGGLAGVRASFSTELPGPGRLTVRVMARPYPGPARVAEGAAGTDGRLDVPGAGWPKLSFPL